MAKERTMLMDVLLPAVKSVGKTEIKMALSGIKERHTEELYRNTLQELYSNFTTLKVASRSTKTSINNGLIDLVMEVLRESAGEEGIHLS